MRALNDEIPDNALDADERLFWSQVREMVKKATPKLVADIKKRPKVEPDEPIDPVKDLETRLGRVVNDWHGEQHTWMLDGDLMSQILQETLMEEFSDQTIAEVIRSNAGLGLREEILSALEASPFAPALDHASFFVAGLARILRDWGAARRHLATRPMQHEEANLINIFDSRRLRVSAAFDEASVSVQEISSRVDRRLSLLETSVRGPRELNRYLSLLSTSYGQGDYQICLMLCRCALEDALKFRFDAHGVDRDSLSVVSMINFAVQTNWLTRDQGAAAHDVRLRANKVLHEGQLDLVKDIRGTIDRTLDLAKALMT